MAPARVVLFANTDWYLYNFRLSLARRLRDLGHDVLLVSPPGDYAPRLIEQGFRWHGLAMDRRSLNPFAEAKVVGDLVRLLRTERPDIVHGFTIKSVVYGSLAARLAGVKGRINAVAGLGHVFASNSIKARALRPLVSLLLKAALGGKRARLILQNPDDVTLFRRARLAHPDRVRLIRGSGVDTGRFTPSGQRAPGEPLKVLLASRLLWDKGIGEYVQAARLLKEQGRSVRFLLAGDPDPGNPAAVPETDVRGWAAEGLVEWLGHVDDMPALLAEVDVMALPSRYGEGVPRSLIEGAAAGLALVTTDHPGCREVVCHEEDGLLAHAGSAEELAQAIARLDDDRALVERLGEAARRKAVAEFDEELVLARTLDVYRELLA